MAGLISEYGDNLARGVSLSLDTFPDRHQLEREQLIRGLKGLEKDSLLEYTPPFRGRGIRLLGEYLPPDKLPVDFTALRLRTEKEYEKLEKMEYYAYTNGCRREFILRYFGDGRRGGKCKGCDNCTGWGKEEKRETSRKSIASGFLQQREKRRIPPGYRRK